MTPVEKLERRVAELEEDFMTLTQYVAMIQALCPKCGRGHDPLSYPPEERCKCVPEEREEETA